MDDAARERQLAAISLLQEPVRRRLFDYVTARAGEVSRNEAAEAAGVGRNLAAFHLDKLAEAGLLEVTFRRLGERAGPGAGRPAKLYRPAGGEVAASVPPRDYRLVADLMAQAVEELGGDLALYHRARLAGERAGRRERTEGEAEPEVEPKPESKAEPEPDLKAEPEAASWPEPEPPTGTARTGRPAAAPWPACVEAALAARGYEPYRDGAVLRLRNCPFGRVARDYPSLVCGMNLALLEGFVAGLGDGAGTARMDPAPGNCCVTLTDGL